VICERCGHDQAGVAERVRELLNLYSPNWMTVAEIAARIEEIGGIRPKANTIRVVINRLPLKKRWRGQCKEYSW